MRSSSTVGPRARIVVWGGLSGLVVLSALVRTRQLGGGFWLDEGLSVGIADRAPQNIPGVLRQDGSPPLYYLLLHAWIAWAGRSEAATHALSLLFALLAIAVAFWAARPILGQRAAWVASLLMALNPFLSDYAQETRMYSLLVLLALITTACWLRALCVPAPGGRAATGVRRAPTLGFSLAYAAMLYTHNWALFFGAATAVAWVVLLAASSPDHRSRLLRTGLIGYGLALALYLPWLPSLLYQAAHTGAPWATAPAAGALFAAPARLLGAETWPIVALVCLASVIAALRRRDTATLMRRHGSVVALAIIAVVTVALPWLISQVSPAWATRYLIAALAPTLLLCAAAIASVRRLGLAALGAIAIIWTATPSPRQKSNVREVAAAISPDVRPGDLIVSTHPGEIAVLHYYLPEGLRYATLTGPPRDLGVTDWRDLVTRLRKTSPARDLQPLLDSLPIGHQLVLVEPIVEDPSRWTAPFKTLVRDRSTRWHRYLTHDQSLRQLTVEPEPPLPRQPNRITATIYLKVTQPDPPDTTATSRRQPLAQTS